MKNFFFKYGFLLLGLLCCFNLKAQLLDATDKSESNIRRYQNVIKNNQQLVRFIEHSLTVRGIPKHLRNLAIIESHLDQGQVSVAGASGVWQFMSEHANEYGLSSADRNDMYKSTKAVTNSLIHLYNKYKNWITVVAAYNCGEGNISKAMTKSGSKKYTDFAQFLPQETQNHVQKYLNASYATGELNAVLQDYYKTPLNKAKPAQNDSADYEKFKANALKKTGEVELIETTINGAYDIEIIAQFLEVEKDQLLKWNPKLEKNLAEKGETTLKLPADLLDRFTINKYKILADSLK